MNKNLKKVISAAAALTLASSSFAALAVDFPDVEATESYAQAVQELSALDVISGYEDGTFRPDSLVTRAEITKMIVDARGEKQAAESATGVSTKFADVANTHWATGYISQGVADGFITGHSDTEFAPDDNVTYVQAQKMLVAAIGYDTYAQAQGGWPAGYTSFANSLGITKGVSASSEDQLTRAQVAQMIDNAMDVPLTIIEKWEPTVFGGTQPVYATKDGQGKNYQTLFTQYHNAYKVYGRVTETSKTGNGLANNQVRFQVEKAENFDDEYVKSTDEGTYIEEAMYIGDTNAANMERTYAQALIQVNDDDEYTILSIVAAAANKSIELLAADFDDNGAEANFASGVLKFFPTGTTKNSVRYQISDDAIYYVNGVNMGDFTYDAVEKYIINNDTAVVTLQKETVSGSTSTSSKYNVVMITNYATAVVDQVTSKSTETTVTFKSEFSKDITRKLTVQKDDDNYSYSFTLNGEAIDVDDLEENDVLSIAYNVSGAFADSSFYDVIVSRDTADGKYTGKNSSDEYTIGSTKYKLANNYVSKGIAPDFETSTEYTIYLDSFGRIADYEEGLVSKNIGILTSVYDKGGDNWVATIVNKEGVSVEYTIDDSNVDEYAGYLSDATDRMDKYVAQVVEYKTTTAGKLTIKELYNDVEAVTAEYKEASEKIGTVRLSDNTVILDISNVNSNRNDIKVISQENLRDGNEYTVYGYSKSNTDSTYRFVLLTEGDGGIDYTSQLAVFIEAGTDVDEDGNELNTMTLVYDDEIQTIAIDDEANDIDVNDYSEGDALIFSLNSKGYIDQAIQLTSGALTGTYASLNSSVIAGNSILIDDLDLDVIGRGTDDDVAVEFGVIVKNGKTYEFIPASAINNGQVNVDTDAIDFTVNNNTKIYTYNFSNGSKNAGRFELDNGLAISADSTAAWDANKVYFDLTHEDVNDDIVFAIVRTVDDEAQEVFQIVAE